MDEKAFHKYSQENPRRDVAVLSLRDQDNNILLMRSHKLPETWQPIGGGVESEDRSPAAAATRELNEEFGVSINPESLKEVMTAPYDFGEGIVYFFDALVNKAELDFIVDAKEVLEYRWFSLEEALLLSAMPATKKYLQKLAT